MKYNETQQDGTLVLVLSNTPTASTDFENDLIKALKRVSAKNQRLQLPLLSSTVADCPRQWLVDEDATNDPFRTSACSRLTLAIQRGCQIAPGFLKLKASTTDDVVFVSTFLSANSLNADRRFCTSSLYKNGQLFARPAVKFSTAHRCDSSPQPSVSLTSL